MILYCIISPVTNNWDQDYNCSTAGIHLLLSLKKEREYWSTHVTLQNESVKNKVG